ncbi:signal transduction protein [Oceanococcus atlanticus]|uniref:diguanylate cyclase n=2 Tax=Oceanococcus atlanticus TaxID=1317117 RepID=A0A1Y1SDS8_9GAMM|nr:signal transduction protein [Oceanococcus atlanticus]
MTMNESPRIALVDDSASDQLIFSDMLSTAMPGAVVEVFSDAEAFLSSLEHAHFDCILLDLNLPGDSGMELLQVLRREPRYRLVPIIMLTGWGNEAVAVKAIKRGATDYLSKRDADEQALRRVIEAAFEDALREQQEDQQLNLLKSQARTDALTGLLNRSAFEECLRALSGGDVAPRSFAVLNIDLNKFKPVNDNFGHAAGDRVLKSIAQGLQSVVRTSDRVFRLGGDEFLVLLTPGPSEAELAGMAERIHARLHEPVFAEDRTCIYAGGGSVGVARYPQTSGSVDEVLATADRAMYEAKKSGRGVVIVDAAALNP